MNVSEAISLVRAQARHKGHDPERISADMALRILDDWARQKPSSPIGRWYLRASDRTLTQFEKRWRRWQRSRVGDAVDRPRKYYWVVGGKRSRGPYRYTRRRKAIASARELARENPGQRYHVYPGNQDDPDQSATPIYRTR